MMSYNIKLDKLLINAREASIKLEHDLDRETFAKIVKDVIQGPNPLVLPPTGK